MPSRWILSPRRIICHAQEKFKFVHPEKVSFEFNFEFPLNKLREILQIYTKDSSYFFHRGRLKSVRHEAFKLKPSEGVLKVHRNEI